MYPVDNRQIMTQTQAEWPKCDYNASFDMNRSDNEKSYLDNKNWALESKLKQGKNININISGYIQPGRNQRSLNNWWCVTTHVILLGFGFFLNFLNSLE